MIEKKLTVPKVPCGSCPYRRGVPSGVWACDEYVKLLDYDRPMAEQPQGVFLCHQKSGEKDCFDLCGGWLMSHGPENLFSLRLASVLGWYEIDESVWRYAPAGVEVWPSGRDAAMHGLKDMENPSPQAKRIMAKITRKNNS